MLLQASVAVATPVLVVLVSAGQSNVMSIGQVITGLVVSWTVIIWSQLLLLPQASTANHVRMTWKVVPQSAVTTSL